MKLPFGFRLTRQKASVAPSDLTPTYSGGAFWPYLHEGGSGFWQRSIRVDKDTALTFPAVYACVTLISSDIAKLGMRLIAKTGDVWAETTNPAYSPVLRRPNRYQNHVQFREHWIASKLTYGNTYALKVRDNRNVVVALYILDPRRVQVLEAPGASVYYRLQAEDLSTVSEAVTVPASEIIHDRMNPIYHPLVGVSPIYACALAAQQGLEINRMSTRFFQNGARPGGILTAPGAIGKDTAERLKQQWQQGYGGDNVGKVAVLGDGLKYESMSVNPVDAQLIQQLNMSEKQVCTAFHVPGYKIGVAEDPKYANAAIYNQNYYTDCLQTHINAFEVTLSEGLGLDTDRLKVDIVEDDLLEMDPQTKIMTLKEAVASKIMVPNEARARLGLSPKEGGDDLWGQQQDHSLAALKRRDQTTMPDGALIPELLPDDNEEEPLALPPPDEDADEDAQAAAFSSAMRKALFAA